MQIPEALLPWATVRGREGFFRAVRESDGRWWLLDPAGRRCFLRAVHGVRRSGCEEDGVPPRSAEARLREWGFNALGLVGPGMPAEGWPHLGLAGLAAAAPELKAPGLRLPDVFAPEWPEGAAKLARRRCAPARNAAEVVGWVTDEALEWAQPGETSRPTLLQLCLSLEPSQAAYHASWELVLALHEGRLDAVARAWGVALPNKEVVRELTRQERGIGTRGYLQDQARWTREFARRYFSVSAAALRAAAPHHLVLGCRFRGGEGPDVLAECAYPAVDVSLRAWRELPPPGGAGAQQPILAGEVGWSGEEFQRTPAGGRGRRWTTVELMLRRARAHLERLAAHPAVAGYVWGRWVDDPLDQPPFGRGLVHVNGREAREHTELLAPFNQRADVVHARALPRPVA